MRRAVVYGRWGYLFSDESGAPQRYIPRYPHKELLISWADAIWIDMKRDMDWYREKYGSAEPVAAATPGT